MIPALNDGSAAAPRLAVFLNTTTLDRLPDWSAGPKGDLADVMSAVREAGYEGVQGGSAEAAHAAGLKHATNGRVDSPDEALDLCEQSIHAGSVATTIFVGRGIEDDDEIDRLIDAVVNASVKTGHPLYIETHRATVTQDCWRTVQLARRHPGVRFNGDFSHWYTGLEMVFAGINRVADFIRPVTDRVRFMHGRIGDPGAIQRSIGDGSGDSPANGKPYVDHFRRLWAQCFDGFRAAARPGDYLVFAPELLHAEVYYARTLPDGREESDRWQQALVLAELARRTFEAGPSSTTPGPPERTP